MLLEYCSEANRKLFLEIAHLLAKSDETIAPQEVRLLSLYRKEAGLDNYQLGQVDKQQIQSGIASAPPEEQRVMALEALCMILVDGIVEKAETKLFNELFSAPSAIISEDFLAASEEIAKDILRIMDISLAVVRRG